MTKHLLKRAAAATLAALIALPLSTAPAWAAAVAAASSSDSVTLDGLDVGADTVQVHLSDKAKYTSFMTASPPRLVIQFEDTDYQAGAKLLAGKGKYLKDVRSSQFATAPTRLTRVVLDLNEVTGFNIAEKGNDIVVALGPAAADAKVAKVRPAIRPKVQPAAPAPAAADASSPDAESAETASQGSAPSVASPMAKVGERDGMTTETSAELGQIADKLDAARPDSESQRPAATTSLAAVGLPRVARGDIMGRLPHDLITIDFDNTDIRDVIRLLAAKAKINIIYGPDVGGALTLHLTDVPFSDAFRTILTMMGLATMQVGDNILRVLTPAALMKSQQATASFTKVIPLNYAKAAELLTAINSVRTAEGRAGTTLANDKTNSLIVTESVDGMVATERLITQLDVRPKQVLIEAKLVEVGLTNSLNYGIQWDYLSADPSKINGQQGQNVIGTLTPPASSAGTTATPLSGNPLAANGVGANGRGTGVQLPADKVFGAMTLGRITNNYFLSATLTAAAAQGKVKVLSDPKIATLNNQPANINVTTNIPYVTSNVASTGVTSQQVSYVTTGIQLSVTPSINADGRITLTINPNVSQPSAVAASAGTTGAPSIDSRVANTTVLVKDGETVVIGGLISDTVSNQIAKVPILGDIPILGWLFKKKSVVRSRAELLIFVTPKIMND
jgi:type IV pilus assembly protein PilQ